jgi:hypothetical protein
MTDGAGSDAHAERPVIYQIKVKGHLSAQWADWFAGLTITLEDNGVTVLTGSVADQAALHGVLKSVRDIGLPLLSVARVEPDPSSAQAAERMEIDRR